jgi:hypothetical protein
LTSRSATIRPAPGSCKVSEKGLISNDCPSESPCADPAIDAAVDALGATMVEPTDEQALLKRAWAH